MLNLRHALGVQKPFIGDTTTKDIAHIVANIPVADDGVYRSPGNVSIREPWNRERVLLQMNREADAMLSSSMGASRAPNPSRGDASSAGEIKNNNFPTAGSSSVYTALEEPRAGQELRAMVNGVIEDVVGMVCVVPRHPRGTIPVPLDFEVCGQESESYSSLLKDIGGAARQHLSSRGKGLHVLDIIVDDVQLSSVPLARHLFSREDELANRVLVLAESYKEKAKVDIDALEQRMQELIIFGRPLLTACIQELSNSNSKRGGPHEMRWLKHVEERQMVRKQRMKAEGELTAVQSEYYKVWKELKKHREVVGFVSTRLTFEALEVKRDAAREAAVLEEEIKAELDELQIERWPQEIDRASEYRRIQLGMTRRPPGASTYRFQLLHTGNITSIENLNTKAKIQKEEKERRQKLDNGDISLTISLLVNSVKLDKLAPIAFSTSSAWRTQQSGSFSVALHSFPQKLELELEVVDRPGPWRPRNWRHVQTIPLHIPTARQAMATHRKPQSHQIMFAPAPPKTGAASGSSSAGGSLGQPNAALHSSSSKQPSATLHGHPSAASGASLSSSATSAVTGVSGNQSMSGSVWVTIGWASGSGLEPSQGRTRLDHFVDRDNPLAALQSRDPNDPLNEQAPMLTLGGGEGLGGGRISQSGQRIFDLGSLRKYVNLVHNPDFFRRGKRIQKLMAREKRGGPQKSIPIFDRELRTPMLEPQEGKLQVSIPRVNAEDHAVDEFIRQIQERTKSVSGVDAHLTLSSMVKEYERDLSWLFGSGKPSEGSFFDFLKPARSLRPTSQSRNVDPEAASCNIHIIISKVVNVPARERGSSPPLSSRGLGGSQSYNSSYNLAHSSSFGGPSGSSSSRDELDIPDVIVTVNFENLDGDSIEVDTSPAVTGRNPDINRHRLVPLATGKKPGLVLTPDVLEGHLENIYFNVFDEVTIGMGGQRKERRFLGSLQFPWNTLYENGCKLQGTFLVTKPAHLLGYRNEGHMYISLNCTTDKKLVVNERKMPSIVPGKEPRMLLASISRWIQQVDANPLGVDIDGYSRLICRFITPQKPPNQVYEPHDDTSIERAAKYVSLIPFLTDLQMFGGKQVDLWGTSKQLLDISCGDWEEHCILLCNFFNYIDVEDRGKADSSYKVESFVCMVTSVPEGDAMYVLRRDSTTGNCEFWNAVTNECFFVPKPASRASITERLKNIQPFNVWPFSLLSRSRPSSAGTAVPRKKDGIPTSPTDATIPSEHTQHCPIQRVDMVFNATNVWVNRSSKLTSYLGTSGIVHTNFNFDDRSCWQPLFVTQQDAQDTLFGIVHIQKPGIVRSKVLSEEGQFTLQEPLVYEPADVTKATEQQTRLQDYLWQQIYQTRSQMNAEGGGLKTRSNAALSRRLYDMCDALEKHSCTNRMGDDRGVPWPLGRRNDGGGQGRHNMGPSLWFTSEMLEEHCRRYMDEFSAQYRGYQVYGVPLNCGYSSFYSIWRRLKNTHVVSMGEADSEYSLGVRIFAYPHKIFSIWVMLVCATRQ